MSHFKPPPHPLRVIRIYRGMNSARRHTEIVPAWTMDDAKRAYGRMVNYTGTIQTIIEKRIDVPKSVSAKILPWHWSKIMSVKA